VVHITSSIKAFDKFSQSDQWASWLRKVAWLITCVGFVVVCRVTRLEEFNAEEDDEDEEEEEEEEEEEKKNKNNSWRKLKRRRSTSDGSSSSSSLSSSHRRRRRRRRSSASSSFSLCKEFETPHVMDFTTLYLKYRKLCTGQMHWRVFVDVESKDDIHQLMRRGELPACRYASDTFKDINLVELTDVIVLCDTPPTSKGDIRSCVSSIYHGEWEIYDQKLKCASQAEQLNCTTLMTTQAHESKQADPLHSTLPLIPPCDETLTNLPDSMQQSYRETMYPGMPVEHRAPVERTANEINWKRMQLEIPAGRTYVAVHQPKPPDNVDVTRQALLESVCMRFGIPMSLVSTGDASGTARLNASSGSESTLIIYKESQDRRRSLLESFVQQAYCFLHDTLEVQVSIVPKPSVEALNENYKSGFLKWPSFVRLYSAATGIEKTAFNELGPLEQAEQIRKEDQQLQIAAQKKAAEGAKKLAAAGKRKEDSKKTAKE
jgi:hypothetical protein